MFWIAALQIQIFIQDFQIKELRRPPAEDGQSGQ